MQVLFPPPNREIAVEEVYRDLVLPEPPADRPYILLNFVVSLDGQATLGQGGAAGLGSRTDHRLMRRLRTVADGLLHGAGTVRKDRFPPQVPVDLEPERLARGLRSQPVGVVISASGDLPAENPYFSRRSAIVVTTAGHRDAVAARLGEHATVIGHGLDRVDLRAALADLRTHFGLRVLLCEGGPRLTHDLVAGGYLDEIYLTLAPKLGGDRQALRLLEGSAFPPTALPQAELLHVLAEGSELFLRYKLAAIPVPPEPTG